VVTRQVREALPKSICASIALHCITPLMKAWRLALAVVLCNAACGLAAQTNLVFNGSFESNALKSVGKRRPRQRVQDRRAMGAVRVSFPCQPRRARGHEPAPVLVQRHRCFLGRRRGTRGVGRGLAVVSADRHRVASFYHSPESWGVLCGRSAGGSQRPTPRLPPGDGRGREPGPM